MNQGTHGFLWVDGGCVDAAWEPQPPPEMAITAYAGVADDGYLKLHFMPALTAAPPFVTVGGNTAADHFTEAPTINGGAPSGVLKFRGDAAMQAQCDQRRWSYAAYPGFGLMWAGLVETGSASGLLVSAWNGTIGFKLERDSDGVLRWQGNFFSTWNIATPAGTVQAGQKFGVFARNVRYSDVAQTRLTVVAFNTPPQGQTAGTIVTLFDGTSGITYTAASSTQADLPMLLTLGRQRDRGPVDLAGATHQFNGLWILNNCLEPRTAAGAWGRFQGRYRGW